MNPYQMNPQMYEYQRMQAQAQAQAQSQMSKTMPGNIQHPKGTGPQLQEMQKMGMQNYPQIYYQQLQAQQGQKQGAVSNNPYARYYPPNMMMSYNMQQMGAPRP